MKGVTYVLGTFILGTTSSYVSDHTTAMCHHRNPGSPKY